GAGCAIREEGGKLVCAPPASPTAKLRLRGRVVWERADARLARPQTLSVYVNGAQQWRGELAAAPAGGLERAFEADILLNRPAGNLIEVEAPGLGLSEHALRAVTVGCKQPLPEQWLHVLVV